MGSASNPHWQAFIDEVPWFVDQGERAVVGRLHAPGRWSLPDPTASMFPNLADLLGNAHTSHVSIGAREYVMFSWDHTGGISTWLSPRAAPAGGTGLFPAHRALLGAFGGIVERSGEPETTWLLNTSESLTDEESRFDATFMSAYSWAFEGVRGGIPIDLTAYYSISREANGNTTLCHRRSGEVLLFAPDHSFDDVEELEGCPPYTLYRRRGGRMFVEWVETVAQQWARSIADEF